MTDNKTFVRRLNSKLNYSPNKKDDSFYKTYKTPEGDKNRQIRVSTHGTYLKFWVEQDYDPSYGINISIAFTKDGTVTNDCYVDTVTNEPFKDCRQCLDMQGQQGKGCVPRRVKNYTQKKRPFQITQFVYNCEYFDGSEIEECVNAIKMAAQTGEYKDPFVGIDGKEAIPTVLKPINENKQYNTTKTIRLTESDLRRMISQCINEALHSLETKCG